MYHTNDTQADTTESQAPRPPTIAELVREVTDNGRLILEFFTEVMRGEIEGAELCHRMDAAKELVKFGSAEAVIFIAKHRGIPCGHSLRRRRNSPGSCIADEPTPVEVTLNAPASLTREFLTVLSGIDEFLMRRLIRTQTAHGDTIIEFLDDVMQARTDGFKPYHRLAAARELIVHILRDEHDFLNPPPSPQESREPALSPSKGEGDPIVVPAEAGTQGSGGVPSSPSPSTGEGWGEDDSPVVPANAEGNPGNNPVVPAQEDRNPDITIVVPAQAGTQGNVGVPSSPSHSTGEGWGEGDPPVVPTNADGNPDITPVVPAQAGTQGRDGGPTPTANPAREPAEEPALPSLPKLTTNNQQLETLPARSPPT